MDLTIAGGGLALLEQLRADPEPLVSRVPIIACSASGDLVEIGQALRLGALDYFIKTTIDLEQILAKILKHIGTSVIEEKQTASPGPLKENDGRLPGLLIVEDDRFLRDLATQKLSQEQLHVWSAVDGEQGLAIAEKEIPDIILLDILLPGIDGFEVLKRLRMNPALIKTRIAMLSNFGQREDIQKALTHGADQFLVKANYTLDEIVQEVKKLLMKPRGAA